MINQSCPNCKKKYEIDNIYDGRTVTCNNCNTKFRIQGKKQALGNILGDILSENIYNNDNDIVVEILSSPQPIKVKRFRISNPNKVVFGRSSKCKGRLPKDDKISRNHFMLSCTFPHISIRDVGSSRGTHINDKVYGGKVNNERQPSVDISIKDGDKLQVGKTTLRIHTPVWCSDCEEIISRTDKEECRFEDNIFVCESCQEQEDVATIVSMVKEPIKCNKCRETFADVEGKGDYICGDCETQIYKDENTMGKYLDSFTISSKLQHLQGYIFKKKLGKGGMGVVYLATRKDDYKEFAIKIMLAKVAVNEKSRSDFLREIKMLEQLQHPGIITIHESGSFDNNFYFVMDHCEPGCIAKYIKKHGKFTAEKAVATILQLVPVLSFIHNKGHVHRDIKPGNILFVDENQVKLSDFGLAKNFENAGFSKNTATGWFAGSPNFMAREQISDFRYAGPEVDIWATGATLYYMLTQKFPRTFKKGDDPVAVVMDQDVTAIEKHLPTISPALAQVINRCIHDNPQERYASIEEFAQDLKKSAL